MGLDFHLKEVNSNFSASEQNSMAGKFDEISGSVKAGTAFKNYIISAR
jgi:hypothetical protein